MPRLQRKIFIDCGAHDGCSIRKTIETRKDGKDYEFYCFEINKDFESFFEDLADYKVEFINEAVWIENNVIPFMEQALTGGSTIDQFKAQTLASKQFERKECLLFDFDQVSKAGQLVMKTVKSMDIVSWIKTNFTKDDYIVLKMDIEGAEFTILPAMIQNNIFEYVNEFLAEFHCYTAQQHNQKKQFLEEIETQNSKVIFDLEWDAMHPPYLKNRDCEEYYKTVQREKFNFRKPLNDIEKELAANKFLNEYCQKIDNVIAPVKFLYQADYINFKTFLNDNNLVENWKRYIIDIGLEKIEV